jgi:alkanesulfonate monooxygenase SsuD/methylene tetrahydromethanopterin reductase-like flavin-dependent oxidoreductase (luciferase family)
MTDTRTPVEVTTRYATTVHTLTDAFAFVMDRLDAAGGHPRIAITPFVSIGLDDDEDERAFEVVVEGTTEETP